MWTWLLGTSTGPLGAAKAVTDVSVLSMWCPGAVPGEWADVCGFLKPLDSFERWKVRLHGAFSIPHDTLGLRPKDQSCHHEVWLHLAFVEHHSDYAPRENFVIIGHTSNTRSHEHN